MLNKLDTQAEARWICSRCKSSGRLSLSLNSKSTITHVNRFLDETKIAHAERSPECGNRSFGFEFEGKD